MPGVIVCWICSALPPQSQSSSLRFGNPVDPCAPEPWHCTQFTLNAAPPAATANSRNVSSAAISETVLDCIAATYFALAASAAAISFLTSLRLEKPSTPLVAELSIGQAG